MNKILHGKKVPKNYWIVKNFFVPKFYLGKLLPRQNVTRQVDTWQNMIRQNVTRQIVTRQNVVEPSGEL